MMLTGITPSNPNVCKITISVPLDLVKFADQQAVQLKTSRSQIISQALAEIKAREEERLAAEGYQFYALEASEFAAASAQAVAEAITPYLDRYPAEGADYAR